MSPGFGPTNENSLCLSASCTFTVHRLAIAAQPECDDAPRRHFVDHPPQLGSALDRCAVHRENDVVLLDARLSGRSILIHHRHLDALFFLQLQGGHALGRDVGDVDAKVRRSSAVFAPESPRLRRRIHRPVLRRK